jgi:GntR family transcriptional regulator, transcriptional repressor for pyruvate dehydrogenase complex
MLNSPALGERRPKNLAAVLVDALAQRIQSGQWRPGDKLPPELAIVAEFGVSRTVVREALSMLQASQRVVTRHGIGTFVMAPRADEPVFRLSPEHFATLREVIAVLELRIGLESEAASLAATRRTEADVRQMRERLDALAAALAAGEDAIEADFGFHLAVAQATQNAHFAQFMLALGSGTVIPRARLAKIAIERNDAEREYLQRVPNTKASSTPS